SGTFQYTRGVQNALGTATPLAPSILAQWAAPASATTLGHGYSANAQTRIWNLMEVGDNYGFYNLKQLDLRASKRFAVANYRFRVDFDVYNVFNSNWPFTVSNTFSNLPTSNWLRPTNVLQARFFKIGAQFDF